MDIRQLHYFLTLCEEMNYTRAAQRLFLSRQALRQSISALEAEMCGPLFISAHHKLALTDRGMSLQRHADADAHRLGRLDLCPQGGLHLLELLHHRGGMAL